MLQTLSATKKKKIKNINSQTGFEKLRILLIIICYSCSSIYFSFIIDSQKSFIHIALINSIFYRCFIVTNEKTIIMYSKFILVWRHSSFHLTNSLIA